MRLRLFNTHLKCLAYVDIHCLSQREVTVFLEVTLLFNSEDLLFVRHPVKTPKSPNCMAKVTDLTLMIISNILGAVNCKNTHFYTTSF